MAVQEFLYATSHVAGDCPSPNNALGAWDGVWAGPTANNSPWTSTWALDDPSAALEGTQTIRVRLRKTNHSTDPSATIVLYEGATAVQTLNSGVGISSTTGQTVTATFAAGALGNPANARIEVATSVGSGGPGNRASVQIDGIEWEASVEVTSPPTDPPTISPIGATRTSLSFSCTAVDGATDYEWQRDESTVQHGPSRFLTDFPLEEETEYSYRVRGTNAEGPGPWSDPVLAETLGPPPPFALANTFEGGTATASITAANSGGASGDPFDSVALDAARYVSEVGPTDDPPHHGSLAAAIVDVGPDTLVWEGFEEPILWARLYAMHNFDDPFGQIFLEELVVLGGDGDHWVEYQPDFMTGDVVLSVPAIGLTGEVPIPVDAWHRVELLVDGDLFTMEVRLYLDPDSETPDEVIDGDLFFGGGILDHVWWCNLDGGVGRVWVDELALSNQGWIGPAGAGIPTGSTQISAAGTIGTEGVKVAHAAPEISAAGTVDVDATTVRNGSATMAAAGTISTDGVKVAAQVSEGSTQISATGALEVDATTIRPGSPQVAGSGALEVDATTVRNGSTTLAAAGTIATDGTKSSTVIREGSTQIGAAGAVETSGVKVAAGSSTLTAAGGPSSAAETIRHGSPTLEASGALTASGSSVRAGSATLSAVGTLETSATTTKIGSSSIAAAGTVTASGEIVLPGVGSTQISAAGTITTTATTVKAGSATISAAGVIDTDGTQVLPDVAEGSTQIGAAGVLEVDGVKIAAGASTLAAAGEISTDATTDRAGTAQISAAGVLETAATTIREGSTALAAAGTITTTGGDTERPPDDPLRIGGAAVDRARRPTARLDPAAEGASLVGAVAGASLSDSRPTASIG